LSSDDLGERGFLLGDFFCSVVATLSNEVDALLLLFELGCSFDFDGDFAEEADSVSVEAGWDFSVFASRTLDEERDEVAESTLPELRAPANFAFPFLSTT
jgi:hypothetical protein